MRYAIINTATTLDSVKGKEALDLALMLASFEFEVSLFFIEDGVYQTLAQQPELVGGKDYPASFKALSFYDIEDIYVCSDSLAERGLEEKANIPQQQIIPATEIAKCIEQHDICMRF